ncbi:hypothetical protein [Ferrimicrobium sp.]|uniref:hypothetical protein n=1 Tax=Ferrimicrobium sp. TaxID=2926050 RepID=UPI0026300A5C|nr:hypothetical protein [Ferrimicrobium sp.]
MIDLEVLYQQIDIVEVSDSLVRRAGALAEIHSLRGCDAVHLGLTQKQLPVFGDLVTWG